MVVLVLMMCVAGLKGSSRGMRHTSAGLVKIRMLDLEVRERVTDLSLSLQAYNNLDNVSSNSSQEKELDQMSETSENNRMTIYSEDTDPGKTSRAIKKEDMNLWELVDRVK